MLTCCCFLISFFVLLAYYPLQLYYDGYLTILKSSTEELNYVFVPKEISRVEKAIKEVKLEYFVQNYWQEMIVQIKWENNYYLILDQTDFNVDFWYLPAKIYLGQQTTLDYLLKIII
ncbi:hypothetical protein [Spiroplasma poulsonii]|uniref:hypothetical protein n=1 Tax=Spiroplasma poulsonii TaxID=2138 RepID=UPI0018DE1E8D|nr:hypothetical protein [Spiroplasma poulsonii]MBH8622879.1 hypothetical protein [Spiroplasma sp. hyd1]UNF61897.1 hypothetical protein MNU24_00045 [Spiroplasma poulsonii]